MFYLSIRDFMDVIDISALDKLPVKYYKTKPIFRPRKYQGQEVSYIRTNARVMNREQLLKYVDYTKNAWEECGWFNKKNTYIRFTNILKKFDEAMIKAEAGELPKYSFKI